VDRLNEMIKQEIRSWEDKSRRYRSTILAKDASHDVNIRRQIIVGGLFCELFPQVLQLQPQDSEPENQVEFAPIEYFLRLLVSDKNYLAQISDNVQEHFGVTFFG